MVLLMCGIAEIFDLNSINSSDVEFFEILGIF